jgi:hypothetical protein
MDWTLILSPGLQKSNKIETGDTSASHQMGRQKMREHMHDLREVHMLKKTAHQHVQVLFFLDLAFLTACGGRDCFWF